MGINEQRSLAEALEQRVPQLLLRFNEILRDEGFGALEIVSFGADTPESSLLKAAAAAPCPTRCRVTPDGRIRCQPEC